MATVDQARTAAVPRAVVRKQFRWTPYLFILPHFIFFAAFLAWPFFYGMYISLFDFDFARPGGFVGLRNYQNLFDRGSIQFSDFWNAMKNTGLFVLYSVPPLVVIALLLAVLLNQKYRGRNFFRGLYFAPYALSVTVASILWWWIFQGTGGLLNSLLQRVGVDQPPQWLTDMPWPWIAITVATVWWTIGFNTVIFLAGLQDIPESLYEAGALDGANPFQQFFYITVPMLRPVLIFVLTITLLASANLFGQPFIMTAGGPVQQTEPVMLRIYYEGFRDNRMGSAAAMSVFVAVVLLLITTLNFRVFGRGERQ